MAAVTDLIGNATSNSYAAPTQYNTWQPSNASGTDTTFNNAINQSQANNPYVTNQPVYTQILNDQIGNPYSSGFQSAANQAGGAYQNAGIADIANSTNLTNASNQVLNTAMDPQNALYARTQQQLQDQINASQASRGITNSGYGADLSNQAMSNFNIDWLNNQLSRQTQGLSAADVGYAQANSLSGAGAQNLGLAGQMPYDTSNTILGNDFAALSGYGQQTGDKANALTTQNLGPMLNYLGLAAQQSNQQGNFNQQYWADNNAYTSVQNAQNAAMWGDIGNIFQNPLNMQSVGFGPFKADFGSSANPSGGGSGSSQGMTG